SPSSGHPLTPLAVHRTSDILLHRTPPSRSIWVRTRRRGGQRISIAAGCARVYRDAAGSTIRDRRPFFGWRRQSKEVWYETRARWCGGARVCGGPVQAGACSEWSGSSSDSQDGGRQTRGEGWARAHDALGRAGPAGHLGERIRDAAAAPPAVREQGI